METWPCSNKTCEVNRKTIYYLQLYGDEPMLLQNMPIDVVRQQVETFLYEPFLGNPFDVGNRVHWQDLVDKIVSALQTNQDKEDEAIVFQSVVTIIKEEGTAYFRNRDRGQYNYIELMVSNIAHNIAQRFAVEDNADFRLLIAMCLLKSSETTSSPVSPSPLSMNDFDNALGLWRGSIPGKTLPKDRAVDVAIAYGCGWRQQQSKAWPEAMRVLSLLVQYPLKGISDLFYHTLGFSLLKSLNHHSFDIADDLCKPEHPLRVTRNDVVSIDCQVGGCTIQVPQPGGQYVSVLPPSTKFIFTFSGTAALSQPGKASFPVLNESQGIITSLDDGAKIDLIEKEDVLSNGETANLDGVMSLRVSDQVANHSGAPSELTFPGSSAMGATVSAGPVTTNVIEVTIAAHSYRLNNNEVATLKASAFVLAGVTSAISLDSRIVIKNEAGNARIRISKALTLKVGKPAQLRITSNNANLHIWECTCGNVRCRDHHRLDSWDPKNPLTNFIIFAVTHGIPLYRGIGAASMFPFNQFRQGIYYQYLAREGFEPDDGLYHGIALTGSVKLWVAPAEYKRCACGLEYTDTRCPRCGAAFDAKTMKIIAKDRLVLLGGGTGGWQTYSSCQSCGNLVPIYDDDLKREAHCWFGGCREPLYNRARSAALHNALRRIKGMTSKRKRLRLERSKIKNCRAGHPIMALPWFCPLIKCGKSKFGQRDVHAVIL